MRNINGAVGQAKMGAAANFTHARVRANLQTNTYQLESWNKAGNGGAGCWQTAGDIANACTVAASPVQRLSTGVTFGFDKLGTAPPNTQPALAQAAACRNGASGTASNTGAIAGTACIEYNSRGLSIDSNGNPFGNNALYVNDGSMVYGVTVAATGMALVWMAQDMSSGASQSSSWLHK